MEYFACEKAGKSSEKMEFLVFREDIENYP